MSEIQKTANSFASTDHTSTDLHVAEKAPTPEQKTTENQDQIENQKTALHQDTETKKPEVPKKDDDKNHSIKSLFDFGRLFNDVRYRNNFLSAANALLHAFATVTNFMSKNNPAFKLINHVVDKSAFICTRWLTPYISYGHAAYTAMAKQKEPILSLIKLIPPAVFPIVGDANIDMVYGTSTAFNQPYDNVIGRINEKIAKSKDYAKEVKEARKNPLEFAKMVGKEFKGLVSDFFHGKADFWKEGIYMINCSMMLLGSLPMLVFGRNDRDTMLGKVSGVLRNLGGTLGDIGWVFGGDVEKEKVIMGIVYTTAQFADVAKRFVGEDMARVLIHLSAALNVSAMTVWNTLNTENTKKTIDDLVEDKLTEKKEEAEPEAPLVTNIQTKDKENATRNAEQYQVAA